MWSGKGPGRYFLCAVEEETIHLKSPNWAFAEPKSGGNADGFVEVYHICDVVYSDIDDNEGRLTFQPESSDVELLSPSSSPSTQCQRQPKTHEQYRYPEARKAVGRSTRSDCGTLRQPRN